MEKIIQIALADDHKIYRDGIRVALTSRDSVRILWEAEDGEDMMNKIRVKRPDILIMDIKMPKTDGIKALQLLKKEHEDLRVIILSMYDDKETITRMMEFGANAYLTKTTDADEIYKAVITCIKEEFYFNDLVNAAVLLKLQHKKATRNFNPTVKFSEKELKILKLISEDKTTEEISENVFLSPRTVETIRQNMKSKVGAKTIAGLLMYGMRNNLLS